MSHLRLVSSRPNLRPEASGKSAEHPCLEAFEHEFDYLIRTLRRLGVSPNDLEDFGARSVPGTLPVVGEIRRRAPAPSLHIRHRIPGCPQPHSEAKERDSIRGGGNERLRSATRPSARREPSARAGPECSQARSNAKACGLNHA